MENTSQKMKICVIGGGFTGMLTAVSVKRHLPHSHVTLIDPGNEMKMPGLGLSMPAHSVNRINQLLNYPFEHAKTLLARIITETSSTPKINMKWLNFRDSTDTGWYSGLPMLPAADIIKCGTMINEGVRTDIKLPTAEQHQLTDLWYELWMAGRRNYEQFNSEINHYYWYCENNRMPDYSIFEHLLPTFHANSWDFGQWLRLSFASELDQIETNDVRNVEVNSDGSIRHIVLDNQHIIEADFYLDCTGFRRLIGKTVQANWTCPPGHVFNNRAVVLGQGYSAAIDQELHPYTIGYGMDYGWTFCIPMKHAVSFGYNFNSNDISSDQALGELQQLAPRSHRIIDPIELNWNPGYFYDSMNQNYALIGISSGFTDPFEAHSVGLQMGQIFRVIDYLKQLPDQNRFTAALDRDPKNYNDITRESFEAVVERLDLHMCLATRQTSDWWRRNHSTAKKHNFFDKIFDVINDPKHYEPSRAVHQFRPYPSQCYLTESYYFGVDMSRRCRTSSPELLQLADHYFKNFSDMNQMRANMAPTVRQWFQQYNIDLDQYITLK
jgi:flavin-dependent dehydrogenase